MRELIEKVFHLRKHGTTVRREVLAGATTFSTMVYIVFVNPYILEAAGMDMGAVMVATILTSALTTLCMGVLANYPFALAPGMGLNAYFTYGIVLGGGYSWQVALGGCFLSGVVFVLLTLTGARRVIMHAIPSCLRIAIAAGIGLFLAFIGLRNVNLIAGHPVTLVTLGDPIAPEAFLTGLGIIVIAVLMSREIKGAIFISAFLNWLIGLATGLVTWQGLVSLPPDPSPTLFQLDILGALELSFLPIILSLTFVAIFDAAGTLISLAEHGGFLNKEGRLPRASLALTSDAVGTVIGSSLGTSPMTTYLESAAGIAAGGRTGLTSVVVALLFLGTLFFAPFAETIPNFATSPALIVVGALMLKQVAKLHWDDLSELIPAFLTLVAIPLTFSIASGIALGFITYPIIKLLVGKREDVHWLIWIIAALFATKFVLVGDL